jgi:hypothetical protein
VDGVVVPIPIEDPFKNNVLSVFVFTVEVIVDDIRSVLPVIVDTVKEDRPTLDMMAVDAVNDDT